MIINDQFTQTAAILKIKNLDLSKEHEMDIKEKRSRRSTNQNSLMWAWIDEVADAISGYTGYTSTEIHNHLKRSFLKAKENTVFGRKQVTYTTTDLTVPEMKDYMDKIYNWAVHDVGVTVKLPVEMHNE